MVSVWRGLFIGVMCWPLSLAANVLELPLKDLQSYTTGQLKTAQGQPHVVMVYQPDCRWCGLQMQDMQRLQQACPWFQMQLVGVHGSQIRLRAELRRYNIDLPAYLGDRRFIQQVGPIEGTPLTLIFDGEQQLIGKRRGYQNEAQLLAVINILSEQHCDVSEAAIEKAPG